MSTLNIHRITRRPAFFIHQTSILTGSTIPDYPSAGHILWELTPSRALFWASTPLLGAGVAFGYWDWAREVGNHDLPCLGMGEKPPMKMVSLGDFGACGWVYHIRIVQE